MRYASVAVKETRQMILQMMTEGTFESRAKTRYRSTIRYHAEDMASGEAPCKGARNLEMEEDAGAVEALCAVGGGVGVGPG